MTHVLHIVAGDIKGGAAKGAYNLHQALLKEGVCSRILTDAKILQEENNIVTVSNSPWRRFMTLGRSQLDQLPLRFYKKPTVKFSTGLTGYDITTDKNYDWADIIHLHWVNHGFFNIKHLAKIKKPVVWTLRDMWPLTGVCHYSLSCKKYVVGCQQCPQLAGDGKRGLTYRLNRRLKKYIQKSHDIRFVCISHWLEERARESLALSDQKIETIYNCINTEEFSSVNKEWARSILGLPHDAKIILSGAQNLKDGYKGFDLCLQALKLLEQDENNLFVFFGRHFDQKSLEEIKMPSRYLGFVEDPLKLRLLYSAADVFVMPSTMEAFGKTCVEAMACATPVVCFDSAGPKEIVDHHINGYKATPYSPEDLAEGIKWVLKESSNTLGEAARKKAVSFFSSEIISKKYKKLYQTLLGT